MKGVFPARERLSVFPEWGTSLPAPLTPGAGAENYKKTALIVVNTEKIVFAFFY
jgi:hypothetical protein